MIWKIFIFLLKRYAERELDQWELWRIKTTHGWVFITISREEICKISPDKYGVIK